MHHRPSPDAAPAPAPSSSSVAAARRPLAALAVLPLALGALGAGLVVGAAPAGAETSATAETTETTETTETAAVARDAERLDRAPVAVATDDGVFLSWRLLGDEAMDTGFVVYRDGERITEEPVTGSTNLLDPDGTTDAVYRIAVVQDGREFWTGEEFTAWDDQSLDIPLDKPAGGTTPDGVDFEYRANDVMVGDLDGDGELELVLKWDPTNSKDNSQSGYTGNVYLDAYELDGTQLWRIDLGANIRAGAHYSQPQVFDFDSDGTAEVIVKTADGTVDGEGTVIGDADADYRNSAGYILDGPEFLTVFEGSTGRAVDTIDYVPARGTVTDWGDGYGNRVDRFLSATAYLDGEHPSAVFARGYYTRAVLWAVDYDGEQLTERWIFDSDDEGNEGYAGQGNHNLSVADVDGDSRDEIVYGAVTIDDDGTGLYTTGLGHGDAQHVGDFDPSRPGLEVFSVHESMSASGNRGSTFRDAATGEILWSVPAQKDTGRGAMADIDPRYEGAEGWNVGQEANWDSTEGFLMSASGEQIGTAIPAANFVALWDGDLLSEIVDHTFETEGRTGTPLVAKWDYENGRQVTIFEPEGVLTNNDTKGNPALQADLLGDWREELIYRTEDSTALRLFTTTDLTEHRLRTLLSDSQYRLSVAWQNVAYNQPPHTSYFLGEGMETPAMPAAAYTTDAPVLEPVDGIGEAPAAGVLSNDSGWDTGLHDGDYTVTMDLWWGQNATAVRLFENGELIAEQDLADATPAAQTASFAIEGRADGTYAYTCELVNPAGTTACSPTTVTVADAAPGKAVLSAQAPSADGALTITADLWWGTNGTALALYQDGELVAERDLEAASPAAQSVAVALEGVAPGEHVYEAVLSNAAGETRTAPLTVTVPAGR
ncbi:rhamnogalacturonan lyase family protein [Brachybacterium sp. DNPG3]